MKKLNRSFLALMLMAVMAIAFTGCKATLDPTGVYHGDAVLFKADQTIGLAYKTLNGFVTWEYKNRETLAKYPEVTKAADFVRLNARDWFLKAVQARELWKAVKSPENQSALETAIGVLDIALKDATTWMATPIVVKP